MTTATPTDFQAGRDAFIAFTPDRAHFEEFAAVLITDRDEFWEDRQLVRPQPILHYCWLGSASGSWERVRGAFRGHFSGWIVPIRAVCRESTREVIPPARVTESTRAVLKRQ